LFFHYGSSISCGYQSEIKWVLYLQTRLYSFCQSHDLMSNVQKLLWVLLYLFCPDEGQLIGSKLFILVCLTLKSSARNHDTSVISEDCGFS